MIVRPDDTGADVLRATHRLADAGQLASPRAIYDDTVLTTVRRAQRAAGVTVDGVYGPETEGALGDLDEAIRLDILPPRSMGGTERGRAGLATALIFSAVGMREIGGNNDGPHVEYLHGATDDWPWCAAAVSKVFETTPTLRGLKRSGSARKLARWFEGQGWRHDGAPLPGDLFFEWREDPSSWKGHIGFVHHVDGRTVYTCEANRGGYPAYLGVQTRDLDDWPELLHYGRIPDS
jgi:hypothetical protein